MKCYVRTGSKFHGEHYVYDSEEEAIANGLKVIPGCKPNYPVAGEWIKFQDGKVAQVLQISKFIDCYDRPVYRVFTVLNSYPLSRNLPPSKFKPYVIREYTRTTEDDLNKVDFRKIEFLEDWLFKGVPIEESVRLHLGKAFGRWKKWKEWNIKRNSELKVFAYFFLSAPWFDEVLKTNRVIRDRYMNLVSAFEKEGMDDTFVAQRLKSMVTEGTEKERINAVNQILTVISSAENKRRSVPATFSLEEEKKFSLALTESEPLQIPQNSQSISDIIKETESEAQRVGTSEAEQIQSDHQGFATFLDGGEAERYKAVSLNPPDQSGMQEHDEGEYQKVEELEGIGL